MDFTDLIFKRYSSPLIFLDTLIDNRMFSKGITSIYERYNDDRFWELYLHSMPDCSFTEWKKRITQGGDQTAKELSHDEVETAVKKSQQILSGFNPTQQK